MMSDPVADKKIPSWLNEKLIHEPIVPKWLPTEIQSTGNKFGDFQETVQHFHQFKVVDKKPISSLDQLPLEPIDSPWRSTTLSVAHCSRQGLVIFAHEEVRDERRVAQKIVQTVFIMCAPA